jgi:DNA-directed RNA polymerase specialized sigma24 family protein
MAASRFEDPFRALLLLLGAGLCAAGFVYTGSGSSASTTAIIAGASLAALGILVPKLREVQFGPGGFAAKVGDDDAGIRSAGAGPVGAARRDRPLPPELIECEPDALNRFAHLVSADSRQAREAVEQALATVRVHARRMAAEERAVLTLRTLIELLDTADERRFLRGRLATGRFAPVEDDQADNEILQALQALAFYPRVAFVLFGEWGLRPAVIAKLLDQPAEAVELDLKQARDMMRPHVEAATGRAHA